MSTPDSATYDHRAHAALPGVSTAGAYSSRLPEHLQPAPIAPRGDREDSAADEVKDSRVVPAVEPVALLAPREKAPEPAKDGEFARSYLSK